MSPRKKNTLLFIFLSFMAILPACARRLPSTSTPVTAAPTSTAQPVLTQVDRGTRSVVPQASPQPSDPSEVQALTPLPPPTERTDLIPTREPEPTETAKVIPSPIPTQVPASAWEGPGVIFIKDSNLMISSFNGTQMSMLSEEPVGPGPWGQDYSSQARRLVYESGNSLWVVDLGKNPHSILSVDRYLESPVISVDGTKIAYSLVTGFDEDQSKQLWTINPDGTENVLAIDNNSRYITDPGPFRLRPIADSLPFRRG